MDNNLTPDQGVGHNGWQLVGAVVALVFSLAFASLSAIGFVVPFRNQVAQVSNVFSGNIYYVDDIAGNDSANGKSPATAWKTITKVNDYTFNPGVPIKLSPGDSVLFKRGGVWREMLKIRKISGTPSNPITFGSYGSGPLPIINGADIVSGWTVDSGNIWRARVSWVNPNTLDRDEPDIPAPDVLIIDGSRGNLKTSKTSLNKSGDWYYSSGYLYIYSNSIPLNVEMPKQLRAVFGTWGANANYITVQDLELKNTLYHLLTVRPTNKNWIVKNITGHHNGANDPGFGNNRVGFSFNSADGALISGNLIYEAGENGIQVTGSSNVIIEKNIVYNAHHHNIDMKGVGGNNIIRYNKVYTTPGFDSHINGIVVTDDDNDWSLNNIQIYGNVIHDIKTSIGLEIYGKTLSNISAYNNTIYNCREAIDVLGVTKAVTLKNNIAVGSGRSIYISTDKVNKTIDNNIWQGVMQIGPVTYNNLGSWQKATGFDMNSMIADPLFTNTANKDFSLQSGSPAINKGTPVGLTVDIVGSTIPQGGIPDIGAYEFVSNIAMIPQVIVSTTTPEININRQPTITNVSVKKVSRGNYMFTANATDVDGDNLYVFWTFKKPGVYSTGDSNPIVYELARGNYVVTVTASDGKGGKVSYQTEKTLR